MKAKKKKPLLKGSHKASLLAAEALRQLLKTQASLSILKRRATMLKGIIMREGGGTAHGYRSYVSSVKASVSYRTVRVKAHDVLKLVKIADS